MKWTKRSKQCFVYYRIFILSTNRKYWWWNIIALRSDELKINHLKIIFSKKCDITVIRWDRYAMAENSGDFSKCRLFHYFFAIILLILWIYKIWNIWTVQCCVNYAPHYSTSSNLQLLTKALSHRLSSINSLWAINISRFPVFLANPRK